MSELPELRATPINTIANAKTNKQIATLTKGGRSEKELTTIAERLVKCWNCHDELVAALEKFVAWNVKYPSSTIYDHFAIKKIAAELDKIAEEAEAALANAKKSK